jgi:hypothetical protein
MKRWEAVGNCIMRIFITCIEPDIRVIRSGTTRGAGRVERIGTMRYAYRILARKAEWKWKLEKSRLRWVGIKWILGKLSFEGVDFIHLAPDRCR